VLVIALAFPAIIINDVRIFASDIAGAIMVFTEMNFEVIKRIRMDAD
jgi:hypothetical protein